ncbi:MAG TPA: hypothetical protein DEO39_04320 [Clostridiales bacterium]|nr:hypothetical protein [Clostridiales bacterium]
MDFRKILIISLTTALLLTSCWDKNTKDSSSDTVSDPNGDSSVRSEMTDPDLSSEEQNNRQEESKDASGSSSFEESSAMTAASDKDSSPGKETSESTKNTVKQMELSPDEEDVEGDSEDDGKIPGVSSTEKSKESKAVKDNNTESTPESVKESTSAPKNNDEKKTPTYTGDLAGPEDPYI